MRLSDGGHADIVGDGGFIERPARDAAAGCAAARKGTPGGDRFCVAGRIKGMRFDST